MSMEDQSVRSAARAGASEFGRHIAAAGDTMRRAGSAARSLGEGQSSANAATAAFGAGLAWWGLRSGGLLGTAALILGGWALSRVWPDLAGRD